MPKSRDFGPMVMGRGCLRANHEAWMRKHQSLGLQASMLDELCQIVPEGF